jgi:hypothetical protein
VASPAAARARARRFQRVSVLNCPGLVAPLTALRGLSGLTHLELGGGCAPDGWEHGYGTGCGAKDPTAAPLVEAAPGGGGRARGGGGGGALACCSGLGCSACCGPSARGAVAPGRGRAAAAAAAAAEALEGVLDLPPSGFEATGHEFRIPMKGVTGRLGSLACHRRLVSKCCILRAWARAKECMGSH